MPRTRHKFQYLLIIIFAVCIVLIYHIQKEIYRPRLEYIVVYDDEKDLGTRDPNVTCRFPMVHPFHPSVLQRVHVAEPIRCLERYKSLTYIDENGTLRLNGTSLVERGYQRDGSDIDCKYRELLRSQTDDFGSPELGPDRPLTIAGAVPTSDFVYVHCDRFTGTFYDNFHAYVRRNGTVRKFKNDVELGVVVIGLDSLSRLNFMRQLSKTYRLVTDQLEAVLLYGFNKVGENTFPNVVPMLTGQFPIYNGKGFEDWPFLWKAYAEEGGATLYAEDVPDINTFTYKAEGLSRQPTHHYMRPYWIAAEEAVLHKMSSPYCLGPTPKHLIYFDYLKSFLKQYRDSPVFLFTLHNELTHDYANVVGAIDDDLVNFFNSSFHEGLFNRSVVFLLGDHGNRLDKIRGTEVGQIEDKMPLVAVILPSWTRKVYPHWRAALNLNRNRLVSTFDLHKTLVEILSTLTGSEDTYEKLVFRPGTLEYFKKKSPGMSLFKPVPLDRDCVDAGIPPWFCTCVESVQTLGPQHVSSLQAARATVSYLNDFIKEYQLCAEHRFDKVERAVLKRDKKGNVFVELMVWTNPAQQLFEVTVSVNRTRYSVIGGVRRINRYGKQANCLPSEILNNNPSLKGICYCKSKNFLIL